MNLNATFLAQIVVFLILWWVIATFIWPPLIQNIDLRSQKIADGLAAAAQGKADYAAFNQQITQEKEQAKLDNAKRIAHAAKQAELEAEIIKQNAKNEAVRILSEAKIAANAQIILLRDALQDKVANLAILGAERILRKEVDVNLHKQLLDDLRKELCS